MSTTSNTTDRKAFIGGNWKCNGTVASVRTLVSELNAGAYPREKVDAVVAPAWIHVPLVAGSLSNGIQVATQNCSRTKQGAFTGEVSADQIKDFGLLWVVLGHSERRAYYGESDEVVAGKVSIALANGLQVIACLGETLEERKADRTIEVVSRQLAAIAGAIGDAAQWNKVVLAYEPVWAIGTGVTASPQQAQEVHACLRNWLKEHKGDAVAASTRIIYGGSVTAANCDTLYAERDIDGFLVGGASLKSVDFLRILNAPGKVVKSRL